MANNIQMPQISSVHEIVTQFQFISNSSRPASIAVTLIIAAIAYSLPLPITALISLSIGAVYGLQAGAIIALSSSMLSAIMIFQACKLSIRSWLSRKYNTQAEKFSGAVESENIYSLISIRWIPGIPFFLVNVALALANVTFSRFVVSSFAGLSIPTLLLVYAGSKLYELNSFSEILSPSIFLALFLLAVVPLALRHFAKLLSSTD
jgi:uncharacterized membrane protein YdjX (TVP38/TMEM64 family)